MEDKELVIKDSIFQIIEDWHLANSWKDDEEDDETFMRRLCDIEVQAYMYTMQIYDEKVAEEKITRLKNRVKQLEKYIVDTNLKVPVEMPFYVED